MPSVLATLFARLHAHVARYDTQYRILQGVLLYIQALYFLSAGALLGFVFFSLIFFPTPPLRDSLRRDWPLWAFACFAICNTSYDLLSSGAGGFDFMRSNGIVGGVVVLLCYLAARTLSAKSLYVLLLCICIEALAVLVQGWLGIRVFFEGQLAAYVGSPYDYADLNRCIKMDLATYLAKPLTCVLNNTEFEPMGFSYTPAFVVIEMLIGLTLTAALPLKHRWRVLAWCLITAAILVTRGRAAIIIVLLMTCVWIAYEIYRRRLSKADIGFSLGGAAAALLLFSISSNYCAEVWSKIVDIPPQQLASRFSLPLREKPIFHDPAQKTAAPKCTETRSTPYPPMPPAVEPPSRLDQFLRMASRYEMWVSAYTSILERPLFGNHSQRAPVYHSVYSNNGYLSILVIHGLIGTLLLAFFYCRRILEHPARFVFLLPLLISNITNDTLFWYISLADILAFYLLTRERMRLFPTPTYSI